MQRRLATVGIGILLLCLGTRLVHCSEPSPEEWSPYEPLPTSARDVPHVDDPAWTNNPLDAFIYSELQKNQLQPAGVIDRQQWLRRVSFDLIGLPPTPHEVRAFLEDPRPDELAYADVVDRLLASPHYGERWARHWLDVVRYADTDGFAIDSERPRLWRYRDYVIRHFNQDRPYEQFVREQLAGDQLTSGTDGVIATGFYRLGPYEADNMTPQHRQQDFLNEITSTIGTAFLGLTVNCARCHDHKYDPIPQSDFYRLQAFLKPAWRGEKPAEFSAGEFLGDLPLRKAAAEAELATRRAALEAYRNELRERLATALAVNASEVPDDVFRKALRGEKIPINKPAADAAAPVIAPPATEAPATEGPIAASDSAAAKPAAESTFEFSKEDREKLGKLTESVDDFAEGERYDAVVDSINFERKARKRRDDDDDEEEEEREEQERKKEDLEGKNVLTFVLLNGDPFAPADQVQPGGLTAVNPWSTDLEQQITACATSIEQRRRVMADWIASRENPLTMRVYVNRIWQYHFGAGIVRTANDFGVNGSGASHPGLLDYLTAWFIDHGQQTKPLHRLIVLSRTYRSSTQHPEWGRCSAIDPDNRYLWRAPLRRLESEVLRDALLAISGRLNTHRGGPGFFEQLPDGMPTEYAFFQWKLSSEPQRQRRSIYMYQRRNLIHPFMEAFDAADFSESCERRTRSVTASQALSLMNGNLASEASLSLARNVESQCSEDSTERVNALFETTLCRPPAPEELADAANFLALKLTHYSEQAAGGDKTGPAPSVLALRDLALVLVNTNEFLYLD